MIGGSEPAVTSHEFHDESREAAKETVQQGTVAGSSDREQMYTCRNPLSSVISLMSHVQILQNLGKSDKTTDEIFEEHLMNFNTQQVHCTPYHTSAHCILYTALNLLRNAHTAPGT